MATLGQQLKAAREAKGVSESEAGKATKILTKLIAAMEADDFSGMAAPTYAKGFIRLYAEYLGLDPAPLVDEYMARHAPGGRKPLIDENSQLEQSRRKPKTIDINFDWLPKNINVSAWLSKPVAFFSNVWKKVPIKDIRILAGGAALLLVIIVLITSISTCTRRHSAEKETVPQPKPETARMLLDEPLPDLYLVEPGTIESTR